MSDRSDPPAHGQDDRENETGPVTDRVHAQASGAVDAAKQSAGKVVEEAKAQGAELLGQAQGRASDLLNEGRETGAEQASGFARAIRHAADDLEGASPDIAQHVRAAADSLTGISDALRERSAGQLLQDATEFARRQPTLFFGVGAIAGFALVRFAMSSAGGTATSSGRTASTAPGWIKNGPDGAPRPATMAAATLGGAAAHRDGDAGSGQMPTSPMGAAAAPRPTTPASQGSTVPNEKSEAPL